MNATRIQVPLTPPQPHFDDESTIVSARQVVPIGRARFVARWRKIRRLLPILLAAIVCGALGAVVVNHFERTRNVAGVAQTQSPAESRPTSQPAQDSMPPEIRSTDSTMQKSVKPEASLNTPTVETTKESGDFSSNAANDKSSRISADPSRLTRKRRVFDSNNATTFTVKDDLRRKTRGAGRIQDIFSGPNP